MLSNTERARRSPVAAILLAAAAAAGAGAAAGQDPRATVAITDVGKRLRVEIAGRLLTEYHYQGQPKPVLYPVIGPTGHGLTRDWPMREGEHEEHDHPHQRSLWFAHGAVNGVDFWTEHERSGRIVHERFTEVACEGATGTIGARNRWVDADGATVCTEDRTVRFFDRPEGILIDWEVTLHASHGALRLGDTKEGTMAIRLHPALRLRGKVARGRCINSAGDAGDAAWGKRAAWVDYWGPVLGEVVGVAIFDHPQNHAHPGWWHARDYGLFAANPFGAHDFEGKPAGWGDRVVPAGDSLTLRYRFYLHRGDVEQARVAAMYREYALTAGPVYAEDFAGEAALDRFVFSDRKAWRLRDGALELFGPSGYRPPVRSPRSLALIADLEFGDFVLDARVMQTGREYGHRDLCLIFGFEDPSHYYYVHLASAADDHAHNVFLVNGAPRAAIAARTTSGVAWGSGVWHRVRVERSLQSGRIAVYFDDLETPIMEARDRTLGRGRIGFGSFDDTGMIDELRIRAPDRRPAENGVDFR